MLSENEKLVKNRLKREKKVFIGKIENFEKPCSVDITRWFAKGAFVFAEENIET